MLLGPNARDLSDVGPVPKTKKMLAYGFKSLSTIMDILLITTTVEMMTIQGMDRWPGSSQLSLALWGFGSQLREYTAVHSNLAVCDPSFLQPPPASLSEP